MSGAASRTGPSAGRPPKEARVAHNRLAAPKPLAHSLGGDRIALALVQDKCVVQRSRGFIASPVEFENVREPDEGARSFSLSSACFYSSVRWVWSRLWNVMKKGLLAGDTLR